MALIKFWKKGHTALGRTICSQVKAAEARSQAEKGAVSANVRASCSLGLQKQNNCEHGLNELAFRSKFPDDSES